MAQNKQRLDKLEGSLLPRQAMIRWMDEVHQYSSLHEWVKSQHDRPDSSMSLALLMEQAGRATEEAMKGKPKKAVADAARQAMRDVAFLFNLHNQVNSAAMMEQRVWDVRLAALAAQLRGMLAEDAFQRTLSHIAMRLSMQMPYPLDPDTAAAVEAAIEHHVTTWAELEDEGIIATWLFDHLVKQGATQLPRGSYQYREGKCLPLIGVHNEKKVRACFRDETEFEKFKAGEDYSNGLADVTDAEFDRHYHRMVTELHHLVDSGQVKSGTVVRLETVPLLFLQEAPLIDGEWLDQYVVELAEWGALMRANGYEAQEADNHPLAPERFVRGDGSEADPAEAQAMRRLAADNVLMFPGGTKEINGRSYLHFEEYCCWHGRKIKGNLRSHAQLGVVTWSWNSWVDGQVDSVATVADVPVEHLYCYVNQYSYQISNNGTEGQLRHRKHLLDRLCVCDSSLGGGMERLREWRKAAETFLADLYGFQGAVASISQRYFDGHAVLFADLAHNLGDAVGVVEEMSGIFDNNFSGERGQLERVYVEAVRREAATETATQTACLVDLAKGETLVLMGEDQAAEELVARHLS